MKYVSYILLELQEVKFIFNWFYIGWMWIKENFVLEMYCFGVSKDGQGLRKFTGRIGVLSKMSILSGGYSSSISREVYEEEERFIGLKEFLKESFRNKIVKC